MVMYGNQGNSSLPTAAGRSPDGRVECPSGGGVRPQRRVLILPALAILLTAAGCERPPYAAASNLRLTPEEERARLLLSEEDQAAVLAAMQTAAEGGPGDPPAPAPHGKRWSDVPQAVAAACNDVEMAVVDVIEGEGGDVLRFRLLAAEGWPGEVVVRRLPPPDIYAAEASIGRFPDKPARIERAERLLEAIDRYLQAFGAKRALPAKNE